MQRERIAEAIRSRLVRTQHREAAAVGNVPARSVAQQPLVDVAQRELPDPPHALRRQPGPALSLRHVARLRERLIAYSRYRDASRDLWTRAQEAAAFYVRSEGGDTTAELTQRYKIDAAKLARALEAALRSAKPEVRTIVRERVSLNEQMDLVVKTMRREGRASFFALVANGDRFTIIVTFLAVLELVRRGRIVVAQSAAFDDIDLLPAPANEAAHAG